MREREQSESDNEEDEAAVAAGTATAAELADVSCPTSLCWPQAGDGFVLVGETSGLASLTRGQVSKA